VSYLPGEWVQYKYGIVVVNSLMVEKEFVYVYDHTVHLVQIVIICRRGTYSPLSLTSAAASCGTYGNGGP